MGRSGARHVARPGVIVTTIPTPSMHHPMIKDPEDHELTPEDRVPRPVLQPDVSWVIDALPLTLEILLNPQEDDEVPQSDPHARMLKSLFDALQRHLEP